MKQEYIICAANWYKNLKLINNKILLNFLPKNIDKGIVYAGHRHPHCMYQMCATTGLRQCEAGEEVQGFLTSHNRFVDREEGAQIHLSNGGKLNYSTKTLFSEDLYI